MSALAGQEPYLWGVPITRSLRAKAVQGAGFDG
jgi:hypothetical protein